MLRRIVVFFFLFQFTIGIIALAGEVREIEMSDGSIINGEVLSLSGGVYTIKSASLGTVKIEESKIRAIRSLSAPGPGSAEAQKLQEKMMNDKEIMSMIQSLQDDADFKKILQDPEIMKAVQSGDIASLMANPQFMKLLDNKTVRDIQKKVK